MIFKGYVCASVCARLLCLQGGWTGGGERGGGLTVHMARQVMYARRLPAVQLQSVLKREPGP